MKATIFNLCYALSAFSIIAFNLDQLISLPSMIGLAACLLLLFTQPPIQKNEVRKEEKNDQFSVILILFIGWAGLFFTATEWVFYHSVAYEWNFFSYLGSILIIIGLMIRIWAIKILGKFFTATVRVQEKQEIITYGPYSLVRHPSYLGAYLVLLGIPLVFHSYWALFFSAIGMFYAYYNRIYLEEKTLLSVFGKVYRTYQERTMKLFPYLW